MRKTCRIVAVAAVVGLLACISVMARGDIPNAPAARVGQAYLKSDIWKGVTEKQIVALPQPSGSGGESTNAAVKETGPVLGGSTSPQAGSLPTLGGSALRGMGMGSVSTPMERTGQQIKQLIRRLG